MTKSGDLPRLLRRIRRRARVLAALEGAVLGGALGAGALAGALALARVLGRGSGRPVGAAVACALGAALIGAAIAGARRISLERCARLADAALDCGSTPRDRVLSALAFLDGPDTPLALAAINDAVSRARGLAPALAAPARRPRQLPGLVAATLALALVGAWPTQAPGARHGGAGLAQPSKASEPGLRIAPRALDAERAEALAASRAAAEEGDVRLGKLATELHATLEALTNGQLPAGEALDRLSDLARRAREAGEEAEQARAALRAAGKALEATAETRGLGRALGANEPDATERALSELARTAGASKQGQTSENVARALDAAAAALASAGAAGGESGAEAGAEAQRRLARDAQPAAPAASGEDGARRAPGERRLERLRRDLEDTASACRTNPEACARRLQDRAKDLQSLQREARGGEARRRLESAARQARERLRRGELERPPGADERRFQRAARGNKPAGSEGEHAQGSGRPGAPTGQGEAEIVEAAGGDDMFAEGGSPGEGEGGGMPDQASGEGQGASSAPGSQESGAPAQGQGAGHEPGGEPLGVGSTPPTRGREREARVRDGAGPTRSEVIESAARRGFATGDYVRVFSDYQPVVEESLSAAAVPEGRRYVVRRYFQLIRPRAARAPGAP